MTRSLLEGGVQRQNDELASPAGRKRHSAFKSNSLSLKVDLGPGPIDFTDVEKAFLSLGIVLGRTED